ncbi:M23 family metallopeptidase [Saccharopolyspora hordei]|uniref:Murein DD-endopeptidase MepM/ murein hydrolase activator NlpD n=1 Tax=Saccharopolyspora hordei TaxID=1838 RepID=A0A853ANW8_9PSEU|nr:M23 family metallopeptidase [Saccharopolyspora hordei]NYI81731.1 murein DD-endopeptidase MepM/ murein hydrolase activator NlpD [Saccharopolyspora hordei]
MAIRCKTALGGLAVLVATSLAWAGADLSAATTARPEHPAPAARSVVDVAAPRAAPAPPPVPTPTPEPAPARAAEWVAPTEGEISSGFGVRWGTVHRGVDVANDVGTPIRAASHGVVIDFGPASGYGLWIRIRHPRDVISTYGHIDDGFVSVGQYVRAGQLIATMGDRGESTGPHLHFQIEVSGEAVDPVQFYAERSAELVD